MEHTPTPWVLKRSTMPHDGEYDFSINASDVRVLAEVFGRDADGGRPPAEANAAFIVRAVNAHDDLVATLQWLRDNYAAGRTLEINERIDSALAKGTA